MSTIVFPIPGNEQMAHKLTKGSEIEMGDAEIRHFPDGETYVRILSDVTDKDVIVACSLHEPDDKLLPVYFLTKTVKELGARTVLLAAPYLAYMRQDKRFKPGEGITSNYFAALLSGIVDGMVTIDPHLHRTKDMGQIYSIPVEVMHASGLVSSWIKEHVRNAVLIGPDGESSQWVAEVARQAGVPFEVLQKIRKGDKDVEVSMPYVDQYRDHTPVLVDDIISTGRTMVETIHHLDDLGMNKPVCIGIHAVFAEDGLSALQKAEPARIVTCNTISHETNEIDIMTLIIEGIKTLLQQ